MLDRTLRRCCPGPVGAFAAPIALLGSPDRVVSFPTKLFNACIANVIMTRVLLLCQVVCCIQSVSSFSDLLQAQKRQSLVGNGCFLEHVACLHEEIYVFCSYWVSKKMGELVLGQQMSH